MKPLDISGSSSMASWMRQQLLTPREQAITAALMSKEVMAVRDPRGFHATRNTTEIFNLHSVKITCQSSRKELFCLLQTIQLTSSSCPDAKYHCSLISPVVKISTAVG